MESANSIHHHHQLQDQVFVGSSSASSCHGHIGSAIHDNHTPNSILNTNGFSSYPNETILNPRTQDNIQLSYSSMAPDLGSQYWTNTTSTNQSIQEIQLSRIKEEISDYYLKYHELFPSINISNLTQEGLKNPDSSDINLQTVDLLPFSRFSGNFSPISSQNQIGVIRDGFSYNNLDHMQKSYLMPLYTSNKVSCNERAAEAKRSSSKMEPHALQNAIKKSRLEARVSCPPFKVRKEKLGDRIAALQQLVAPFGKTDTASVLMEAIGYIKFLQMQVETLSVPYMKRSWNKTTKLMKADPAENESEEPKRDLGSRGLCLVPLSCMSYITDGGGGVVWPSSPFGGAS